MSVIDQMLLSLQTKQTLFISDVRKIKKERFPTAYKHLSNQKKGNVLANNYFKEHKQDVSRSYAIWTKMEKDALKKAFVKENTTIRHLSKIHKRTPSAIACQLKNLGIIVF